jgi:hypothetical protein
MNHPFDLKIAELESIDVEITNLNDDEASQISGGLRNVAKPRVKKRDVTTKARGEEGGEVTTLALGEEGGEVTTQALGEEGGEVTTLALGEEGGHY